MFLISRNKRLTFLSLSLRLISSSITTLNAPTTTVQESGPEQKTSMAASLKFLTVAARAKHTATVIVVHVSGVSAAFDHGLVELITM